MRRGASIRLALVLGFSGLLVVAILARGAYISIACHDDLLREALRQQTRVRPIPAPRGPILDRHGSTLACTRENALVAVRLTAQSDRAALARYLETAGVCSASRARELMRNHRSGCVQISRGWLSSVVLARLAADAPDEIELSATMKRYYPCGPLAPELVGIVKLDGTGGSGLEIRHDAWLTGHPGRKVRYVTGGGWHTNAPPEKVIERPRAGGGLQLSIDACMQEIAQHHLRAGIRRLGATAGHAILLDPWTGEILALCEEPTFDPLQSGTLAPEALHADSYMDQYEPGSTFKIVPFIAALEAGVIAPDDTLHCGPGVRVMERCRIRDHRPFGVVTAAEVFSHSSNIGAGRIAERVGWEGVFRSAQALGFGMASGIDLAGEAHGYLPHPRRPRWSERSLVTIAYGQEVACNGLQLGLAYAAIANGGVLMKPLLVRAFLDASGDVVRRVQPQVVRQAMSPETAHTVRELLRQVVTEGTGGAAEVAWFPTAGKTGTAQIFDPERGGYSAEEHVLSFVGFAPYDAPRIVCTVSVRCTGDLHASEAAAPIFASIVEDVAPLLGEPGRAVAAGERRVETRVSIPDVRGLDPLDARRALLRERLIPVLEGRGPRVEAMRPQAYRQVRHGRVVHLTLGGVAGRATVQVPEVRGLSLRRAISLFADAGLALEVNGSGWVVRQDPAPGTEVSPDASCAVWGSPDVSRARRDALGVTQLALETG